MLWCVMLKFHISMPDSVVGNDDFRFDCEVNMIRQAMIEIIVFSLGFSMPFMSSTFLAFLALCHTNLHQ